VITVSESLTWITSTFSASGNCVAVAADDHVLVRDTKDAQGPVLRFSEASWREFTSQVKAARGA
jgi:Domain of unknown function (DUF397)